MILFRIVFIFALFEVSFFGHWSFVRQISDNFSFFQKTSDPRCLVSCIKRYLMNVFSDFFRDAFIGFEECDTIMHVSGKGLYSYNESMMITDGMLTICKAAFFLSFVEHATFRIDYTLSYFLQFFLIHFFFISGLFVEY